MPVNVNVTISDEAHKRLDNLKKRLNLRNYAEVIEYIINEVAKEEFPKNE